MRRLLPILAATLTFAGPAAASSPNVQRIAQIPEMATAISINTIGDTMFVSTVAGVFSYDIADPARPRLLGALPMYIWENEDVDLDARRKLLFVSRDPRGFTSPAAPGSVFPYGAVHVVDVGDPAAMSLVSSFLVPAGHTTTCVNACDVLWTSGPGANPITQAGFAGRPIYATDVTDPADPKPCDGPIDTDHDDGTTGYVHDVQVDVQGVAWVSGQGGVRGYWTSGTHTDPKTGQTREATGCDPIPYAGSGTPEKATTSRFMHNAWRDARPVPPAPAPKRPKCKTKKVKGKKRKRVCPKPRPVPVDPRPKRTDVLLATEENIVAQCASSGRFVAYDLRGTYAGEGFKDAKHRMTVLDTWTPEGADGAAGCSSAHYFTKRDDGVTANAFYEQGVRFLDVGDPSNIRQVGWYRESDSNTWAAYWRPDGIVLVADFTRGVEILRFKGSPASRSVRAPILRRTSPLRFDSDVFGGLCPLPA